ncbi:hypothetical protein XHV734_0816 [Xanthomonas hortorum pv. vitians]|nr:hypothetical protein XHV734_0816 [Xanthomonas hortorum pv. vitians]
MPSTRGCSGLERLSKPIRSRQAGAAGARGMYHSYTPFPPRRPNLPSDCSLRFVSHSQSPAAQPGHRSQSQLSPLRLVRILQ